MVDFIGEREFSFHGARLAAKEWGSEGDFPILALHGWLDNCGSFDVLAPLLNNVHLIALDMAGHGLSSHRVDHGPYNIWQDVADLYHVIDELGWQRFALLGHSRGAMISTMFAGTFAEKVTHLALIDSVFPMPVMAEDAPKQLRRSIAETQKKWSRTPKPLPDEATAIKVRQSSQVPISERAAEPLVRRGIKQVEGGVIWSTDPKLLLPSAMKLSIEHIESYVDAITAPIHVILAKQGMPKVYQKHQEALKRFPKIKVSELEGSHHLHLEDGASEVARIFNDFFQRES